MAEQPQIGAIVTYNGKPHRIVSIENGEAELEEVVDPNEGGPPSESVMDERGMVDRAVDYLPAIAGTVASLGGATRRTGPGMAISGAAGAAGELGRQGIRLAQGRGEDVPDTFGGALTRMAGAGATQAVSEGLGRGVVHGLTRIAKPLMSAGLGPQRSVVTKFPGVDLPAVALREGTFMDPLSRGTAAAASKTASQAVGAAGRAADAAGTAPIQSAEVLSNLTRLRDDLIEARMPDLAKTIDDRIAAVQQEMGTGLPIAAGLKRKTRLQRSAKSAIRDPGSGSLAAEAFDAEQGALTKLLHDEARVPGVGPTLTRAMEMKALKAAQPAIPKPSLANAQATIPYVLRKTLASPDMQGRYGIAADRMRRLAGTPAGAVTDLETRAGLLELLNLVQPRGGSQER